MKFYWTEFRSTTLSQDAERARSPSAESALVLLLSRDEQAEIQTLSFNGHSALSIAACVRNDALMNRLLDLNADVDCMSEFHDQTSTPLQLMCECGCPAQYVERALKRTTDAHSRLPEDQDSWSLLHLSTSYFTGKSDPEVFRLLVNAGISVDLACGPLEETPLSLAIDEGSLEDVVALLECGADPSYRQRSNAGWYPFARACYQGRIVIAKYLLEAGAEWEHAKVNHIHEDSDNPLFGHHHTIAGPLQLACMSGSHDMVRQTLQWKHEGYANLVASDGPSALFWASWAGDKRSISMLIDIGLTLMQLIRSMDTQPYMQLQVKVIWEQSRC